MVARRNGMMLTQTKSNHQSSNRSTDKEVEAMEKKETEFLTEEEAEAILRVPDRRTIQGKRDYAITLTLLSTGLRKAEICNLKIGDLKTYRNQAVIDVMLAPV